MKLSELRPCDGCGGPAGHVFYRLQVEQHVVRRRAVDALAGTARILGGSARAFEIAQALTGDPPDATVAFQSAELRLCTLCFCDGAKVAAAWTCAIDREDAAAAANPRA